MRHFALSRPAWKISLIIVTLVFLLILGFFLVVPAYMENKFNPVRNDPPYHASAAAQGLHKTLLIVDLHADSLLWNRDLLKVGSRGQVDIPRLIEGNVALQIFTVVTRVPKNFNIQKNADQGDRITLLAVAQRWPREAWSDPKARALHQARKLKDFADRSNGKLTFIKTQNDLSNYLQRRKISPSATAGILGIEGAHALGGDLNNLDLLFAHGFRMIGLTHLFDNDIAGSAHGVNKGGLTEKGKQLIRLMESRGMIVDLAHASAKTIDETLAMATRPVVVSHTGVKGTCDNVRNLSDAQIRGIARTGGLIGIGYWDIAVCGNDAKAIAKAIRYTANLVGVAHVGLGSDFDGAVETPFDTRGVIQITDALLANGFSEPEIRLIMGENMMRLLRNTLP